MGRRWWKRIGWAAAGVAAAPLLYLLAALVLGLVPANARWQEPEQGITIFVRSNGVHTWIVMPKLTPQFDWRPFAPPEHLRDPRYGWGDHVAVGYGEREFYLNTPRWSDLRLSTAVRATLGFGDALMHVEHAHAPQPEEWQRPIRVTPAQYRRLATLVAASFRTRPDGATLPLLGRGYNDWDMFYEAHGGYSAILTCNEWTGRMLRGAGIRTGLWTPLEQSIMWRL